MLDERKTGKVYTTCQITRLYMTSFIKKAHIANDIKSFSIKCCVWLYQKASSDPDFVKKSTVNLT